MAGVGVLEVSDATFEEEVLKSEQPVLVDFGQSGAARAARSPLSLMEWRRPTRAS